MALLSIRPPVLSLAALHFYRLPIRGPGFGVKTKLSAVSLHKMGGKPAFWLTYEYFSSKI